MDVELLHQTFTSDIDIGKADLVNILDLHWLIFVIDLESGKADLLNIRNFIGCIDAQIVSIFVWKNGAFSYSTDKIRWEFTVFIFSRYVPDLTFIFSGLAVSTSLANKIYRLPAR